MGTRFTISFEMVVLTELDPTSTVGASVTRYSSSPLVVAGTSTPSTRRVVDARSTMFGCSKLE